MKENNNDPFDFSVKEGTDVGWTKREVENFDLVLMFKQIEVMLTRYYEPADVERMINASISAQDRFKMPGVNLHDDDIIKKNHQKHCPVCGIKTFHHILSYGLECAVCQNIIKKKGK